VSGAPEPRIWIINRLGQIERQGTLPALPQAAPVPLGKRVVVPIEGKLHVARTGQGESVIQDFQFPSGEAPPVWKQVLAADEKTLIGLTEAGELLQIRLESKANLAQIARQALPGPVVGKVVMSKGQFATACSTGDVLLFDATKLEPRGQRTLETPASGAAYVTEAGVLVETGDEDLHCLNPDAGLTTKWTIKLSGSTLSGQPAVIDGNLVLTFQSGLVLRVNPDTGTMVSEQQASGSLNSGPLALGQSWFVMTWDGSLIPLTAAAP
jgi:outer membrane protein assembly factor BamB